MEVMSNADVGLMRVSLGGERFTAGRPAARHAKRGTFGDERYVPIRLELGRQFKYGGSILGRARIQVLSTDVCPTKLLQGEQATRRLESCTFLDKHSSKLFDSPPIPSLESV